MKAHKSRLAENKLKIEMAMKAIVDTWAGEEHGVSNDDRCRLFDQLIKIQKRINELIDIEQNLDNDVSSKESYDSSCESCRRMAQRRWA